MACPCSHPSPAHTGDPRRAAPARTDRASAVEGTAGFCRHGIATEGNSWYLVRKRPNGPPRISRASARSRTTARMKEAGMAGRPAARVGPHGFAARNAVDGALAPVGGAPARGQDEQITEVGSFSVSNRRAQTGREASDGVPDAAERPKGRRGDGAGRDGRRRLSRCGSAIGEPMPRPSRRQPFPMKPAIARLEARPRNAAERTVDAFGKSAGKILPPFPPQECGTRIDATGYITGRSDPAPRRRA